MAYVAAALQGPRVVQDPKAGRMNGAPGLVQYGSPNETELGCGALRNRKVWNGVDITHSNLVGDSDGMEKSSGLGGQETWVLVRQPVLTGCGTLDKVT